MKIWKPISLGQTLAAVMGLVLVAWMRLASPDNWVRILDDANLVFHEAGHPIFGLLGSTLGLYGGTLGQLVFPIVTAVAFWRQAEPLGFALGLAWMFENFLNIARYMADARTQILPLVGGGEHDWTAIFSRWHVLSYDTVIAGLLAAIGWIGFLGCGLWLVLHCLGVCRYATISPNGQERIGR